MTATKHALLTVLSTIILSTVAAFNVYADSGETLYQTCIACHGDKAQGNTALKAPALAGQHAWYVENQLKGFAKQHRGAHADDALGAQMTAIAKQLNDKDMATLAAYIEGLPAVVLEEQTQGDLKKGYSYYQAKCGACHGANAEGSKVFKAPKLANLSQEYLRLQMQNFANGIRGTHKEDKLGRQMAMMAKTVSPTELNNILFFIAKQK